MRVLWFTNTASQKGYNGGGWVSSLEACIGPEVTLATAFLSKEKLPPAQKDGVMYYPVYNPSDNQRSRLKKLLFGFGSEDRFLTGRYLDVVNDFKPDVIQIFGSEHSFALIAGKVSCPVVLHVQGILAPYFKAYMPSGMSWGSYIFSAHGPTAAIGRIYTLRRWRHAVSRERKILASVQNYICRTSWDRAETLKSHPGARIFHGDEVLRPVFYEPGPEPSDKETEFTIVTIISEPPYKGMDLVLRCGKLLKSKGFGFVWKVYGNVDPAYFARRCGITPEQAGITLCGVADAATLAGELRHCGVYVHPSYIDNSPNSVCEAQMMGAIVAATAVGGVPDIVSPSETGGYLVPAGDAEALCKAILEISSLPQEERLRRRDMAKKTALARHDKGRITSQLLEVYNSLILSSAPLSAGLPE